jgi:hypothetical protein
MAKLTLNRLNCIRRKDVLGKDEPSLEIDDQEVWSGKMDKGDSDTVNVDYDFTDSVVVRLRESNDGWTTVLRTWTIRNTPTKAGHSPLTATSSGYHYELFYDVD